MNDHPKCEEKLTKKWSPRLVTAVNGVGDAGDNSDQVNDEEGCGWNEKGGPFEHVELSKVSIFI